MFLETRDQSKIPIIALCKRPALEHVSSSGGEAGVQILAIGFTCTDGSYQLSDGADNVSAELGVDPFAVLDRARATGSGGEAVPLEIFNSQRVQQLLLVGLGQRSSRDYRRAGATIARAAQARGEMRAPQTRDKSTAPQARGKSTASQARGKTVVSLDSSTEGKTVVSLDSSTESEGLGAFVEGLVLGSFGFERKSSRPDRDPAPEICLTGIEANTFGRTVDDAIAIGVASWLARYCAITPSNEKSPQQLESWSRELIGPADLQLEVWDDARLAAEGFGGISAVGSASAYASRFLRLDYVPRRSSRSSRSSRRGADKRGQHVVLVGKGITFDTGGISLKPRDAMMSMKRDMTGAAVVMGVMSALRDLDVGVRVTGLVAAAENAFGAAAMRPGDVVTHYGGRTSEVGNTDAEGRLVLADALAYAEQHIDAATAVVDIATLTGAGKVALGTSMGALFCNDDTLAGALESAGLLAGEPVWRLPLAEEYEDSLESQFADATNAAGGPGAITAALFLQHFAGSKPWAHLDIASVGDSPEDAFEYSLGATGFGVRLLLRWLQTC